MDLFFCQYVEQQLFIYLTFNLYLFTVDKYKLFADAYSEKSSDRANELATLTGGATATDHGDRARDKHRWPDDKEMEVFSSALIRF